MKVTLLNHKCIVDKEPTDKPIYDESRLLYLIKMELRKQGYDVIKKLMNKDGYLVSDDQYYIQERKGEFIIWFSNYQIRLSYQDFNEGQLTLNVER